MSVVALSICASVPIFKSHALRIVPSHDTSGDVRTALDLLIDDEDFGGDTLAAQATEPEPLRRPSAATVSRHDSPSSPSPPMHAFTHAHGMAATDAGKRAAPRDGRRTRTRASRPTGDITSVGRSDRSGAAPIGALDRRRYGGHWRTQTLGW